MNSRKSIVVLATKFLLIYGLLAALWPLARWDYALLLREHGKIVFRMLGARDFAGIHPAQRDGLNDTMLSLRMVTDGPALELLFSSWLIGFHPTILLVALILSTPISAYRRTWALLIGLAATNAVVTLRLIAFLAVAPLARLPDNVPSNTLRWLAFDFSHGPAFASFLSILIWVAVTFRKEDFLRLVQRTWAGGPDRSLTRSGAMISPAHAAK